MAIATFARAKRNVKVKANIPITNHLHLDRQFRLDATDFYR